jgi:hypothetical protein
LRPWYSDVAEEFRGKVEFVVDDVFHVYAGDTGVLKQLRPGKRGRMWF